MSRQRILFLVVGLAPTCAFVPQSRTSYQTARKQPIVMESLDEVAFESLAVNDEMVAVEDLGKEIFLSNMPVMQESVEMLEVEPKVKPVLEPLQPDETMDNVGAILAASSEAVAAAEASLGADIGEKLRYTTPSVQASTVVGEPVAKPERVDAPTVGKILKFAIPAIGVWLCGPLLSLIDTSAVGILSGTVQQAALNPAVAVTDYSALLVAFLYTATTNLIAAARETDRTLAGSPRTTKTLSGALQLSTFVGAGLGAILFCFAPQFLRAIIGNSSISPAVFDAALKYVRIRALGMPAAAVIGSAQAACLGMQDIRSPLYVLVAAAVVNFLGDMMFVGSSHAWIGGAAGAAWATVFSQYAALGMFMHWLCNKPKKAQPKVVNLSNAILELTGDSKSAGASRRERFHESLASFKMPSISEAVGRSRLSSILKPFSSSKAKQPKEESTTVRGFLDGKFSPRDLLKFPTKTTVEEFKEYIMPVTTTQVGRVSGYVAMSHVVSSSLGTFSMAAQQVIVSLFYCLCPIADSLSLTAQSFVPSISERKPSAARTQALKQTTRNLLKAGGVFGAAMVSAVACIPFLSGCFTTDMAVRSLVNSVAPLLVGFFAVHGVLCTFEGLLLAQKDLKFLGKMYAGYSIMVPYFMLRVKAAALSGSKAVSLKSVWQVFLSYQFFRVSVWAVRISLLQRRTGKQSAAMVQVVESP